MEFMSFYLNNFTATQGLVLLLLSIFSWILFRSTFPTRGSKGKPPLGPIGLPILGYLPFLGKEPHKIVLEMRKKYGDIIGLYLGTKYTVVLNEYDLVKEVLSHPGALDRAPNIFDFVPNMGFFTANGEEWVEQRRFCLSATRNVGLGKEYWEDIIMEEVTNFMDKLEATKEKAVDVSHDLCASLTSNIICLLIGRRLREVEEAEKLQLCMDFSDIALHYLGPSMATSVIPGLRKFCEVFGIAGYDKASRIVRNFSLFVREEINRHKTCPDINGGNDFINSYLEKLSELKKSKTEKHYFSEEMLEGNVTILFLGSTDTIFNSLIWLLRLMGAHKDIQQKVYTELIEVVGKDGRARYEEREKFPYSFATVMEAQRISSIGVFSATRSATQDIHIKDVTIPKGSEITANLWALHYDPKYWEQPEEFRPERFLEQNGTKLVTNPRNYAAFSFGRRNCPGTSIAYTEILLYFSEILKKFEVSLPPGVKPEFKVVPGPVSSLEPLPLLFKKREDGAQFP